MNTTTVTSDERIARAELTWLAEPRDRLLGALVRASGAVEAMALIRAGRLPHGTGLTANPGWQRAMSRWHAALEKVPPRGEVERALGGRFRLLYPGCAEWPGGLEDLGGAAPVALWVTGAADLGFSCRRSVAVTGARAATAYGVYLGSEFGGSLAGRGWAVVSGASFGIDASAHRGALGADGVTIAVTAGGLDEPYPAGHADLLGAVAAQGALVSEAPPGVRVSRLRFEARHRVIAALATGTVIIEAGSRSGAMTAARHARDLGRPVMAVPGPVTSDLSSGCHELIQRRHAVLVTCASDVINAVETALAADS
jgi:DNA processing protein